MEKYNKLKEFVLSLEHDVGKFYEKGVNDAGTRLTVSMQDLKKLAQELRMEVFTRKKNNMLKRNKKRGI
jgi:hypothetical protein